MCRQIQSLPVYLQRSSEPLIDQSVFELMTNQLPVIWPVKLPVKLAHATVINTVGDGV